MTEATMHDLEKALARMAEAEGVDAANLLIMACAPTSDLVAMGEPLKGLTTSEGRRVGVGPLIVQEVMGRVQQVIARGFNEEATK